VTLNRFLPHRTAIAAAVLALAAAVARGDAYHDLVKYEWSQGRAGVSTIEQDIRDAKGDVARHAIEAKLLKALAHPDATYACKQFVCRMMRRTGSKACVAPLTGLLADEKLSHMARFALQHLDAPGTTDALIKALAAAEGEEKLGIVTTLGERGDPKAVPALTNILPDARGDLRRTTIHALGRIASPSAAQVLGSLDVAEPLKRTWADAYLRCADKMLARGEEREVAAIYVTLFGEGRETMTRIAALRGLVMSQKAEAVPTLLEQMRGEDPELAAAATRFAIEMPGQAATRRFAQALADMPADGKLMLMDALTERGDAAAAPFIRKLLTSKDEEVRLAAVRALGDIGDAESVAPLARIAASDGDAAKAATNSLNRLRGEGVAEAMGDLIDSPDPALRAGILSVLATRADKAMAPAMLKAARDKGPTVRQAAIKGLTQVAGQEQLDDLVQLMLDAESSSEQAALARALSAAAHRVADSEARVAPIVEALPKAKPQPKARLLAILSKLGGETALEAVRENLDAANEDVATAAVRALHDWPDPSPAPDLLRIIKTTENAVHKVLAFRGYVRMANMGGDRPMDETLGMYKQALNLATTVAEKKSVLSGLANARTVDALELIEPLLKDKDVRAEAELATIKIASNARDTGPSEARAALKKLAATTESQARRKQAQQVINEIDKNRGFIRTWLASGPYSDGNSYDMAYPPEKDGQDVQWTLLTRGIGDKVIDLDQAVDNRDHCAAYMKTYVWSPADGDVQLQIGSDDGVKVWVNGKQVHANPANRPAKPNQDQAKARFTKGWNQLLVKVIDNSGNWGFCVRVVKPDGGIIEGLRVSVEAPEAPEATAESM
jgi:HEAT repeat protein